MKKIVNRVSMVLIGTVFYFLLYRLYIIETENRLLVESSKIAHKELKKCREKSGGTGE